MSIKCFIYAYVVFSSVKSILKIYINLENETFLILSVIKYVEEKWNSIMYVDKNTDLK